MLFDFFLDITREARCFLMVFLLTFVIGSNSLIEDLNGRQRAPDVRLVTEITRVF